MKRALIIYAVLFFITIAVPAIVCFVQPEGESSSELVNIFRQQISLIEYCPRIF